jgi:hypothetical protein
MANENQLIRTITKPTIVLDDIQSTDVEEGTSSQIGSPASPVKYSKQYGAVFPLVQINGRAFNSSQITSMRIQCGGKIPGATVTLNVNDKSFYSTSFPKDGDLLSIFIRSRDDVFRPIRNDYEIAGVSVFPREGGGENTPDDVIVSGKLRIPGYDAVKCFSKKGSSLDAILSAATDLSLGFATNEVDTKDSQTWICPFETTERFIEETSLSAWKDEISFYTWFIDHYYYLNFVNVNPMFSEAEIDEGLGLELLTQDFGKDSVQAKFKGKTVLSNWDDISGTNFFIQSYALVNGSSSISLSHGYRRYAQFYDALVKENQSIFVDPQTTEDAERDKQLLKGRPNENFYLQQINTKWMGAQYGGNGENCHENFNYARITNFQNNVHLPKMGLKITLENANFNLRRMQPIPVIIVIKKDYARKKLNEPIDEDQELSDPNSNEPNRQKSAASFEDIPFTIDKTISGFYVIESFSYIYDQGKFSQECFLVRREWPTPPQLY